MRATILFPGDYFSLNNPDDSFAAELDAVTACDELDVALFNYNEYIEGAPLKLNKPASQCAKMLIYRGWMMKPNQYERFYSDLVSLGFDPLTSPSSYERMHCFPSAGEIFRGQTPQFKVYPAANGRVEISADEVNASFDRFMVKDYVKSVKGTSFPTYIKTPIAQKDLDSLIEEFIKLRGALFTGDIVLKEFVDLKRYGKATNEWREFRFLNGIRLALARNSNQPDSCRRPPNDYLVTRNMVDVPFYTVDYAELEDGSWTILEVGDGGVSGLAAADNPIRFYEKMADALSRIHPVPKGLHAIKYDVFDDKTEPEDVKKWLSAHPEKSALAYCYAYVHNRSGLSRWESEFSPDGSDIEENYNAWFELSVELFGRIEKILESEDASIQVTGMFYKAAPFMARNGYADGCGWWVAQ